jgi:hypothetical protein
MPPLERCNLTPLSEDVSIVATVVDNDDHQNNSNNNNRRTATTADACGGGFTPLPISPNDIVQTERDLRRKNGSNQKSKKHPTFLYEPMNKQETKSTNSDPKIFCGVKKDPLDLIDLFMSNLCVGPCAPVPVKSTRKSRQQQQQQPPQLQRPQPVQLKKRRTQVVYPIAKYANSSNNLDNHCPDSFVEQQQRQQRRRPLQEEEHNLFFRPVQDEHIEHSAAKKPKLEA